MSENMSMDLEARAGAVLERAKLNQTPDAVKIIEQHYPTTDLSQEGKVTPVQIPSMEHITPSDGFRADLQEETVYEAPPSNTEMAASGAVTAEETMTVITTEKAEATPEITEDDFSVILSQTAKSQLGAMPEDAQSKFMSGLLPEMASYRKSLIITAGLTPAEAGEAAVNRTRTKANEAYKSYAEDHPDGVIITIDKSQESSLQLDDDTLAKMQKAKALKLVVVESRELETIKIQPSTKSYKMSRIRDICGSISKYSIPLLSNGDYASFIGAQSGILANATAAEDDDILDAIDKKASLLYKYFSGSTLVSRIKDDGSEMTYEEFCNWYHYDDMDMGVYAIVTASAMETTESTYKCQNETCQKLFQITYNNKALLDLSGIPDEYKTRLADIDGHRSSPDMMSQYHEECNMVTRFKSPVTNNIYEIGSPSIATVRNCFDKCMKQIDSSTAFDALLLLYVDKFYVFASEEEGYIPIDVRNDPAYAFEVLCQLHQADLELITKQISNHKYHAEFKIRATCPFCKRDEIDQLTVDSMVFLHARASLTEID